MMNNRSVMTFNLTRITILLVLAFAGALTLPILGQDEPQPTIGDYLITANAEGDFTLLVQAVVAADLVNALSDTGARLTLFAPTDAAFEQLLEDLGITEQEFLARDDLADILLYHIVGTDLTLDDLREALGFSQQLYLETLDGPSCTMRVLDDAVLINDAQVITADIPAANGVIHVIDHVLMPEDETNFIFSPSNAITGTITLNISGADLTVTVNEAYINAADAVEAAVSGLDGLDFSQGGVSGVLQIGVPGGLTFSVSFGDEGLSITSLPTTSAVDPDTDASLSGILSFDVNEKQVPVRIISADVDLPELLALLPALSESEPQIDDISGAFEVRFGAYSSMTVTVDNGAVSIGPGEE